MAGGGSIPLEAIRLGLPIVASDLNPVAFICLKGTVDYPAKFGKELLPAVQEFCEIIHKNSRKDLEQFFPKYPNEDVFAYLWARTIICPKCGLIVPLSPNWWIIQDPEEGVAAKPSWDDKNNSCSFEILNSPDFSKFNPENGTTSGGDVLCLRCNSQIDSAYIKQSAHRDLLGHQLYCVCIKRPVHKGTKWAFRKPFPLELESLNNIQHHLDDLKEFIPDEKIPLGLKTREPLNVGISYWKDLFNPRQLLTHATYLKHFENAKQALLKDKDPNSTEEEFTKAVCLYGAMVFDSCINYNSIQGRWHSGRGIIAGAMDMQAFPFRWSYAEWNQIVPSAGYEWALRKTLKSLKELIDLMPEKFETIEIINSNAQSLPKKSQSIDVIVVDPPYGNNVMYAEISDFFYIWLKRLIGDLYPNSFQETLTNKEDEAVANSVRFAGAKRGQAKILADQDYAAKMEACFSEMHRTLKDEGVLCVMFTHREPAAWEGLAESLMNAGFTFKSSWPVHTEPGAKFGKANKGALKVTVILYCRKRKEHRPGRWEDVVDEIQIISKQKVKEYQNFGITGPDLLVSLYGPALGKFSEYYPVKDITGKVRSIGDAFTVVAEVVNEHLTGDIEGADMESLAYLNLLRNSSDLTMEYDLARICTVFGGNTSLDLLDIKGGTGLVKKAGSKVQILTAKKRFAEGILNPERPESFRGLIDIVHASLLLYEKQGIVPVTRLLQEIGKDAKDAGIISVLSAIGSIGEDASSDLGAEARIANALLEALGHSPAGIGKTGEKITHWT